MKTLDQILAEKTTISVGAALSDGWALVSKNFLYYILGGILTVIISGACGFIPFAGSIANSLILSPCLMAGAIYVTWQISNNKPWTDFADMFKGFGYLVPLMISTLIQTLLMLILAVLLLMNYIPEIMDIVKLSTGGGSYTNREEIKDIVLGLLSVKTFILILIVVLISLIISIFWAFKSHFIVVYKMDAWPAMEASRKVAMHNFFEILGLFIVLGLIVLVSALPCGLGLFFTLPWMISATYCAFAQITESNKAYDISQEDFDFMKGEEADL